MFNGDWESGNLDKQMAGNVGFFLMPPAKAGGKHAAMSAPLTYGIGAKAKHPDCAAFFLNWVATNDGRHARSTSKSAAPIRAVRPTCRCLAVDSRQRDRGHARRRHDHRQGQRRDGLHRQRHRRHLRRRLDAGAAEDGRRPAGCRRPAEGGSEANTRRNFRAKGAEPKVRFETCRLNQLPARTEMHSGRAALRLIKGSRDALRRMGLHRPCR